jgi:hypothetical protein
LNSATESAQFHRRNCAVSSFEVDTSMNTMANSPVAGQVPELSVKPVVASVADIAVAVGLQPSASTWSKVTDTLTTIYAYGLLAFGLFFPLLLAAWHVFFGPAAR